MLCCCTSMAFYILKGKGWWESTFLHICSCPSSPHTCTPFPQDTSERGGNKRRRRYTSLFWTSEERGAFQNAPRCRFFLDVRKKGREFRERERGRRTGGGVKDGEEEIEECRKKSAGERERKRGWEHNRMSGNGFVYPAGGETVSHFLCFGGSGLISPSVTSVSLAAVTECDTKVFKLEVEIHWLLHLETVKVVFGPNVLRHHAEQSQSGRPTGLAFEWEPAFYCMHAENYPQPTRISGGKYTRIETRFGVVAIYTLSVKYISAVKIYRKKSFFLLGFIR